MRRSQYGNDSISSAEAMERLVDNLLCGSRIAISLLDHLYSLAFLAFGNSFCR